MKAFHTQSNVIKNDENPVFFHRKDGTKTSSNVAGAEIDAEGFGILSFVEQNVQSPFQEEDLKPRFKNSPLNLVKDDLEFSDKVTETDQKAVAGWKDVVGDTLEYLTRKMLKNKPDNARKILTAAQNSYKALASACTVSYDYETLIEATEEIKKILLDQDNPDFTHQAQHFNGLCFVALGHMLHHYFTNDAPEFFEWHTDYFKATNSNDTEKTITLDKKRKDLVAKYTLVEAFEKGEVELDEEQKERAEKLSNGEDFEASDRRLAEQIFKMSEITDAVKITEQEAKKLTLLSQGEVVENSRELLPGQIGFLGPKQSFGFNEINDTRGVALVIHNTKDIRNESGTLMAEKGSKTAIYLNKHSSEKEIDFAIERLIESNSGIERKDLRATIITNGDNDKIQTLSLERAAKISPDDVEKILDKDVSITKSTLSYLRDNGIAIKAASIFESKTPNSFVVNEDGAKKGKAAIANPDATMIKVFRWLDLNHPNAMNIAFKDMDSKHNPAMISPHYKVNPENRQGASDRFINFYNAHTQELDLVIVNKGIPPYHVAIVGEVLRNNGQQAVDLYQSCEQALATVLCETPQIKINKTDPANSKIKTRQGNKPFNVYEGFDMLTAAFRKFLFPVFFGMEAQKNNSSVTGFCAGNHGKKPLEIKYHLKNGLSITLNEKQADPIPRTLLKKAMQQTSHPEEVFAVEREAFGIGKPAALIK